jgi:hypothetical protein
VTDCFACGVVEAVNLGTRTYSGGIAGNLSLPEAAPLSPTDPYGDVTDTEFLGTRVISMGIQNQNLVGRIAGNVAVEKSGQVLSLLQNNSAGPFVKLTGTDLDMNSYQSQKAILGGPYHEHGDDIANPDPTKLYKWKD